MGEKQASLPGEPAVGVARYLARNGPVDGGAQSTGNSPVDCAKQGVEHAHPVIDGRGYILLV